MNHALLGDAERWYGRLDAILQSALVIHGTHDPVLLRSTILDTVVRYTTGSEDAVG